MLVGWGSDGAGFNTCDVVCGQEMASAVNASHVHKSHPRATGTLAHSQQLYAGPNPTPIPRAVPRPSMPKLSIPLCYLLHVGTSKKW